MVDSGYILAPPIVSVRFDIAPAFNALQSIRELNEVHRLSGFADWITETVTRLPQERLDLNFIVFETCSTLFFHIMPVMTANTDYLGYVDTIEALDPYELRDQILSLYVQWTQLHSELWAAENGELTLERLISDEQVFVMFMSATCNFLDTQQPLLAQSYALFQDPPRLLETVVEHLRWMWHHEFAAEWERVQPMLYESAAAFSRLDFSNMTLYEAARIVTTRDLRGMVEQKLEAVDSVVFVPSAHIGPYVVKAKHENTLYIIFGARLPRGVQVAYSALSRSELLTRLNALADDTRLRILELLTQNEEMCAQDIIERLDLSQSSISRHLSQLSANGFITERRREVAKCYSLNTDRVIDTLRTLTNFLSRP